MDCRYIIINNEQTHYLIYENGDVFSEYSNKFLKKKFSKQGYIYYNLSFKNKLYTFYAHKLVVLYFLPKCDNNGQKLEINHIDGNKLNNHYSNLEWVTRQENLKHQFIHCLNRSKPIVQYDIYGNFIAEYRSCSEAGRILDFNAKSINACCNKKVQQVYGYIWRFKDDKEPINFKGNNYYLKNQKIEMYDKNYKLIKVFDKISDVYKYFGKKDNGAVSQVCKGRRKSLWGFYFKYQDKPKR